MAGMVGLSVGGHVAYLAAAELDLPAVAVVYGGWIPTTDIPLSRPTPTIDLTSAITGRVLILVGDDDRIVPPPHRRCDRRDSYAEPAATNAWQRIARLLGSTAPAAARSLA